MKLSRPLVTALLVASAESPSAASTLLDVFPASNAPTFYEKPSEFVVSQQFSPWHRKSSHWVEGVEYVGALGVATAAVRRWSKRRCRGVIKWLALSTG